MSYKSTSLRRRLMSAAIAAVVAVTLLHAPGAEAVTNGQTATVGGVNPPAPAPGQTTSQSGTSVSLNDPSGGINLVATTNSSQTSNLVGWAADPNQPIYTTVPVYDWVYVSYEAVDVNGNKLPRGCLSRGCYGNPNMRYVPYWNFLWWGGNGNSPDLSPGHENEMNLNCDENAYMWSGGPGAWKRRWPSSSGDHQALITNPNNRFGSWGIQADNYYNGRNQNWTWDQSNWNGNRDHTNLGQERIGWYSGCVRHQSFRWQIVRYDQVISGYVSTPVYSTTGTVNYNVIATGPTSCAPTTLGASSYSGTPSSMTLRSNVNGSGQLTSVVLTFSDGYTITINNPTTCQGSVAGPTPPPTSRWSATPGGGSVPLNVNFTDTSTAGSSYYPVTSWSWTFTGANVASSSARNPSVTFTNVGANQVCLTARDSRGVASTGPACGTINVGLPGAPTLSLTPASTTGVYPMTVNYTATVGALPSGWQVRRYVWNVTRTDGSSYLSDTQPSTATSISRPITFNGNPSSLDGDGFTVTVQAVVGYGSYELTASATATANTSRLRPT